jgi:signal transduction histidine kinase
MRSGKRLSIWLIIVSNLAVAYLQLSALPGVRALHAVYTELYYLPLLLGAVVFGMRGALLTYLFTSAIYFTCAYSGLSGTAPSVIETSVHLLVTVGFAVLAGFLVDRERRQRQQLKKQMSLAGLGQSVAAVVHDLKSPLMMIMAFVRRAREGKGDLKTAIEMINYSAQNMDRAVRGILDFAKPIEIAPTEQDVRALADRVCEQCRPRAEEEGVGLVKDFSGEPVMAAMDVFCMERALANLVNNAIEASQKGQQVTVTVEKNHENVVIKVTDHGQGMDKETLAHAFTPFYSKKSSGTGLGMAITKKIVDEHEGEISIRSELGAGTEVTVTLPCGPPGLLDAVDS